MSGVSSEAFERHLRSLAAGFAYPPTPALPSPRDGQSLRLVSPARRAAWGGLAIALAGAGLLTVRPVRAALADVLRAGAVSISLGPTLAPPPDRPTTPTAAGWISVLELEGETTLEAAREHAAFALRLPTYPEDLGAPDHVFVQGLPGQSVVLVWLTEGASRQVALSLQMLGPDTYAWKETPPAVANARVHGQPAYWTTGPYTLILVDGLVARRRLVEGHALIWVEGQVTYRLETARQLRDAIRIAESLQ
jgi:hypothetical protein